MEKSVVFRGTMLFNPAKFTDVSKERIASIYRVEE
jgi:hypothetical protein